MHDSRVTCRPDKILGVNGAMVLTDQATPSGRVISALRLAGAFDGHKAVVVTLSTAPDPLGHWLHIMGIPLVRLGESGARSVDSAVEGACLQWQPDRVLCFAAPRALAGLRWVRGFAHGPALEFVCARAGSQTWPETEIMAIRGHNVFHMFHVEDDATRVILNEARIGDGRIGIVAYPEGRAAANHVVLPEHSTEFFVHGVSWELASDRAASLAASARETGRRAAPIAFGRLLELAVGPGKRLEPAHCTFVETALDSDAPLALLRDAGWVVHRADPGESPDVY